MTLILRKRIRCFLICADQRRRFLSVISASSASHEVTCDELTGFVILISYQDLSIPDHRNGLGETAFLHQIK